MEETIKGAETPKTEDENMESLQELESKLTAKEVMDMELEDLDTVGYSVLDDQSLKVQNIIEVHKNREKLVELIYTLPHQTRRWIVQRLDVYDRLSATKFFDWYNSKKELSYKEYRELEYELNKDKDGVSLSEMSILTKKDENQLFQDLRAGCGLSVVNIIPYEFIMEDYLYVRLIPLVNENNQLEEEIRTQYLLKGNALQYLAEYWGNGDIVDTWC